MEKKFNVKNIYIDTVGSAEKYKNNLFKEFGKRYPELNFEVAEKADSTYPITSAASICAKVTRDHMIRDFSIPGI